MRQRILMIDGAMGTMIQRHKLKEEDFRGEALEGARATTSRAESTCSW